MENIISIYDELSIEIEHTFKSAVGYLDAERYIKRVKTNIYNGEFVDNKENEFIGSVEITILLLGAAKANNYDVYEIFDTEEWTLTEGEAFYDF